MDISLKGSGEYKPQNAEGFPHANDEATPQVAFITHKVTKTGVCLGHTNLNFKFVSRVG